MTEQDEADWRGYCHQLELKDNHHAFLCRPFVGRPNRERWEASIEFLANDAESKGFGLVIFDSLPNLWGVNDENDAAQVIAALQPLQAVTKAGAANLAIMHPSKSRQNEGRATRGSGAIGGYADALLEFYRFDPEQPQDRRRILRPFGRPGFQRGTGRRVARRSGVCGRGQSGYRDERRSFSRCISDLGG